MSITRDDIIKELERRKRVRAFEAQKKRGDFDTKYDPTEGMSGFDKFAAGVGSSAKDLGRKAVNLALPDSLTPEFASDDAIREQANIDKALLNTGAGMAGRLVGDIGITAPVTGGVVGALAKGGKAAATAYKAAGAGEKALRYAGTAPGRAVLEGGLQGAWASNPDEGAEGAMGGAVLGAAANKTGQVLRKAFATGLAKPSKEALRLEKWAEGEGQDIFTPLAGRAKGGGLKEVYKTFVPALPGAKTRLENELLKAQGQVRQAAGNASTPFTNNPGKIEGFATDPHGAYGKLEDAFEKGYGSTLNKYVFKVDKKDFADELETAFEAKGVNPAARAEAKRRVMSVISENMEKDGTITGSSMKQIKHQIQRTLGELAEDKPQVYEAIDIARKKVDAVVDDALTATRKINQRTGQPRPLTPAEQQVEVDRELIRDLDRKWGNKGVLEKATAAAKNKGGRWTPNQAISGNKNALAKGDAPLQKEMSWANDALGGTVYSPTVGGRVFATGLLLGGGGAAGGALGGKEGALAGAAGAYGLSRAMTSPAFQRALMGNTSIQKQTADLLRKHRQMGDPITRVGRTSMWELLNGEE